METAANAMPSASSLVLDQFVAPRLIGSGSPLLRRSHHAEPFLHLIIDDFFLPRAALRIASDINALRDSDYKVSFRSLAQSKLQLGNIRGAAPGLYAVYEALMSDHFTRHIENVSGYRELQADRQFAGAGLHRYRNRGFSEIHLDSNRHPFDVELRHRVNLIVFLNPLWRSEWGGELVLWSERGSRPDRPAAIIEPRFNRAVIFNVTGNSWHSVNRIRCPRGMTRNSMAIYYFNRIPEDDDEEPRSVIWHSTRGFARQALFEVSNRLINKAKPHARYFRWLRSNKFDGVRPR